MSVSEPITGPGQRASEGSRAVRPAGVSWLHEWTTTVDHKRIGILYILTALVFLVVGGIEALLMRWQLFAPRNDVLGHDTFNQLFTMHGTTMVFFVGMPILIGMGNYLVPLMIGARDMAFPRLNAFSFWVTLLGGLLVYLSFITGGAPAVGWFAYAPLTEKTFAHSAATDFWSLGLITSGIGTIGGAVNFVATILGMRAPGMTLRKLPFFVWTMLWTAFQMLLAIPPLTAALIMVTFDRQLGAHFFDVSNGGSAYLWQHLFWFFGHPEVYILILPVFGMVSEVIPVFSRKVLFGYEFMAAATMAIAFISLGVWAHHMFCVGMGSTLDMFFATATFLVSIPTGIKFFNWLATMYGGRISFASPMLFAFGFLSMFLIGGLTGIMLGRRAVRLSIVRQLFRRRTFSLGADRRNALRHVFRHLLLVSEDDRSHAVGATGPLALLAVVRRLHSDVRPHARLGHARHAQAHLYLRCRSWLGTLESTQHAQRARSGAELCDLHLQPGGITAPRQAGRRRSLERLDARMEHHFAAAVLQF